MDIHPWVWVVTVVVTSAVLLFDVVVVGRRPHEPSMRECARALALFVGAAIAFGIAITTISGVDYGAQFFAGWLTEYSLSVDNLFVFIIIMAKLDVPRQYQQTALLVGIVLALLMRGIFIAVGAAAISAFSWVFYLFGIFLIYTAVKLVLSHDDEDEAYQEPKIVAFASKHLPLTREWNGVKLTSREGGRRMLTPMFVVILTLGLTDLLFALDSIPAIFGLTSEPFIVFTANVFALMGLRQLYFLIGDLLKRLVYLSIGLSVLLAFIGVKLVLEALHTNELPFINGGEHVGWAPEVPIWASLVAIVGILTVTTLASLAKDRKDKRTAERV
ncbi:TerC/Alx family metal homeostasis membrane protein [Nocardioides sp. AX2bis]|uniref:TerC/Alx family metal homeostasis membrane protein n=1 Tax=Nocardioides sp. AX2bis TaxID=2653157 RepID=UPI0012F43FB2|nr:TerC/Alx family metal homeostasis membrane protein [Nocardioides sp. AX2bis]VXA98799.1 Tellurium resistance protein TerC [Nocardioides sp. AX2bis]